MAIFLQKDNLGLFKSFYTLSSCDLLMVPSTTKTTWDSKERMFFSILKIKNKNEKIEDLINLLSYLLLLSYSLFSNHFEINFFIICLYVAFHMKYII